LFTVAITVKLIRMLQFVLFSISVISDVGLARLMKDQTELTVVKLKGLPQLTAKGLTTLCSPLLEILNLKSSGVTSEGEYIIHDHFCTSGVVETIKQQTRDTDGCTCHSP